MVDFNGFRLELLVMDYFYCNSVVFFLIFRISPNSSFTANCETKRKKRF